MNKAEMIEKMSEFTGTKKAAQEAVDTLFNEIKESIKKAEAVSIAGFGIFKIKERKARTGRNPKTGETIQIPAKKSVGFKPAKDFKEML